ncbi:hypothetical protein AB9K32_07820 [Allomuricauda sp. XS_ASV26]|uniref:hypothetical protein n=1 Tax=Allomuricauda sp. XS_ASV26 TaxID=3241292 RepID=UPI0035133AB4
MVRVHLTNIEYDYLFNEGGDSLIAFLATLRAYKSNETIKKIGKNGTIGTINKTTGLSRTIIKKHLPKLIDIGLVNIHQNGNIAVRSRKWSSNNLPKLERLKLIPIMVYNKFVDTKTYSAYVRVNSRIRTQERQIGKKARRIEVLRTCSQNRSLSKSDYRLWKSLNRKGTTLRELLNNYRSTCTISNLSFHRILKDTELISACNKNSGKHFKKKLIALGLIEQKRVQRLEYPGVWDVQYSDEINDVLIYGAIYQSKKGIVIEESPIITIKDMFSVGNKKKQG